MKNAGVVLAVLFMSTLACSLFSGGEGDEIVSQNSPTESLEIAGVGDPTEDPEDAAPTETPMPPGKNIQISTKQPGIDPQPTQIVPTIVSDEGVPDGVTELFYPYQVEQHSGDVEVTVTDFRIFELESGTIRFIGLIQNTGGLDISVIRVHVSYLGEDEEVLGEVSSHIGPEDFLVGGKNLFAMYSEEPGLPEGVTSLFISFDGQERWEGSNATQEFETLSVDGKAEQDAVWDDIYSFNVKFRNLTKNRVTRIYVYAILYNQSDQLVGYGISGWNEWGNEELPPGEVGEISFICRTVFGTVDHYEIIIAGDQIFEY